MIYHFTAVKPHFVCHSKSQLFIVELGIYNFWATPIVAGQSSYLVAIK